MKVKTRSSSTRMEKLKPVPLCPRQIPHGVAWDRTRAPVVKSRGMMTAFRNLLCCYTSERGRQCYN